MRVANSARLRRSLFLPCTWREFESSSAPSLSRLWSYCASLPGLGPAGCCYRHHHSRQPPDSGRHVKARIFTRAGDVYRCRMHSSVTSTHFGTPDTLKTFGLSASRHPRAGVIHIYVKERPTIREINYLGAKLGFDQRCSRPLQGTEGRTVGRESIRSHRIKKAEVAIRRNLLAEHGRQFATIRTEV